MIDLERLLRFPFIDVEGGFDISPDGTRLAFAWNISGQWEIYELDLNASDSPRPVSVGQGGKFAPRYSPDGSRLAHIVDFNGGENYHILVQSCHSERSEESLPLDWTPDIDFAIQPNFCWSPDGTQIAFLADKSGCFDTYVISASSGEFRLLLANGLPAWSVCWSPDEKYLAVMSEAVEQDYAIFIIPLDGSSPYPITARNKQINAHNPAWSPDSTKLAFHSDTPNGFHQIGVFDVSANQISWLTNGQTNCRTPTWSKDGKRLTYIHVQGALDKLVVHALGGVSQEYQVDSGVHYKSRFSPDDKHVVFAFNNPRRPPDLWMLTPETGDLRQLTKSLTTNSAPGGVPAAVPKGRSAKDSGSSNFRIETNETTKVVTTEFIMPEEITYPGMEGAPIPALLFKSDNANEITPAVVIIHGGPNWHYRVEWYPLMSHIASRGWTVLAPNYRGSTGYSRDWQYANRFNLGGVDTDDVTAGAHYLIDNKLADPKRIAVTGRSHGGYLTMSCLTRYPDLWCAGSAVVPFLNWFTAHENSREDLQHWDLQNFGNPKDNYDLWYERSPLFFLDKVKVPVQLICGENDPRCPASESIRARDKLLELGKEVDFNLYMGEGHVFLKTENVVDAEVHRINFLAKALE